MSLARASGSFADIDRINEEARRIDVGRALLTAIAAVLYAVGWLAGKLFTIFGFVVNWTVAAVMIGWRDARARSGG